MDRLHSWGLMVSGTVVPPRYLDRCDETVASPGNVNDEPISTVSVAQRATQGGNMDCEVGRLDEHVRPDARHQLLLADQCTGVIEQDDQDLQRTASKRN